MSEANYEYAVNCQIAHGQKKEILYHRSGLIDHTEAKLALQGIFEKRMLWLNLDTFHSFHHISELQGDACTQFPSVYQEAPLVSSSVLAGRQDAFLRPI